MRRYLSGHALHVACQTIYTIMRRSIWYTLCFVLLVHAQTCENYGVANGTNCACPVGFGGSTCSQLGCGGTIFQGSQRKLTSNSGSFANLTASNCQCESGWTGTGCNVCQTASACQSGFAAVGQPAIDSSSIDGSQGNSTIVCNTQAQVYASSQMSCQVNVCSFSVCSLPCSPDWNRIQHFKQYFHLHLP